jgi:choline dehydrogenase
VPFLVDNPKVDWRYESEPNETHGNRKIPVPRGKMLGGSSSINAIVYNRGQRLDYDTWSELGCKGWSYREVLPYLKKLESTDIGSDAYRGRSGPIKVTQSKKLCSFFDLFIRSANVAGIPYNPDYSGEKQEGVAMAQLTAWRGERQSTATSYLQPARHRLNLTILTGAEATSLILEGKRCVGVRYSRNGVSTQARLARGDRLDRHREYAQAAGAVRHRQPGDPAPARHPGRPRTQGRRREPARPLRGHHEVDFQPPRHFAGQEGAGWRLGLEILRWVFLRQGLIAQGHGAMRVFARSRPELKEPDVMMVVSPYIIELKAGKGRRMSATEGFFMYTHVQRTESTGNIHIRSADPLEPPTINFRFLETDYDRQTAVAAVRRARDIAAASPMREVIAEETVPGPQVESDEAILETIRNTGLPTQHMAGTCKMGNDEMAVVDERLRVHGLTGLRIADASVMPTIVSGNTSVPCMMIGEKCADMVLADAQNPQSAAARTPQRELEPAML